MRNKALQKILINLYNPDVTFSQEIIKNPRMIKIYFYKCYSIRFN